MLEFERRCWAAGHKLVAGIDEAGRGPLAGPVVAAAVCVPCELCEHLFNSTWKNFNDSKRLTDNNRRAFFLSITETAGVLFGIGQCSPQEIDQFNILKATHLAMARAVSALSSRPDQALVDGLRVNGLPIAHEAIVGGDGKSLLIAAASILAKVTRDNMMLEIDRNFPQYGFAIHKGYGTKKHLESLRQHGPCPEHRRSFAPVSQSELRLG